MNTDARTLDHKTLTELRKRAVASVQQGQRPEDVARALGINLRTVFRWLALYRSGGWGKLDARKRGGRPPKLEAQALKWVYDTVLGTNPLQLKFPFALWTTAMIGELIAKRFGVHLSRSSVCRLLAQMGLSAQRPLWRAYQQDPEAVRRWKEEDYPALRRRAGRLGAQIFFGDEAGVRSDFHSGTTWGLRGQTPIVSSTGARFRVNMISAVSAQGQLRFMLTEGRVTASVFVEFLRRLMARASAPIFLVVDGHSTHKAKLVRRFVESQGGRLELHYLPAYSPELNPDELVWNNLKTHTLGRKVMASREELRRMVLSHLHRMQKLPALIRSFFRAPTTRYTAL